MCRVECAELRSCIPAGEVAALTDRGISRDHVLEGNKIDGTRFLKMLNSVVGERQQGKRKEK